MNCKGETKRQSKIQYDINFQNDWEWQDKVERIFSGKPWREVDNREAYIKKRMLIEGLK